MNQLKQYALVALGLALGSSAFAQGEYDNYSMPKSANSVYVNTSLSPGGLALGADFEHDTGPHGIGGYTRFYQREQNVAHGIFSLGGFIRPHFRRKEWSLYVSPGFGIHVINSRSNTPDDETVIGPVFMTGVLYAMSPTFSLGAEYMTIQAWTGEDAFRAIPLVQDISLKARFAF